MGGLDSIATVSNLVEPAVRELGYALVQLRLVGGGMPTLQVMAEPADGRAMTVDDCARISEAVSALLDVENPIAGTYRLEVSSPGIDRPLVRPEDFDRFAGHVARIETERAFDGRKRFTGRLLGRRGEAVAIEVDGQPCTIPAGAIRRAKLVLTEELVRAAQVGMARRPIPRKA